MPTKLYVSNIAPECKESDLHDLFSKYGDVSELDIVKNYAFVHMRNHNDAQNAVANLNNHELHGNTIHVQMSFTQNINRGNKSTLRSDRDGPPRDGGNFRGRGGRGDFPGRDFRGRGRGGFQGRGGDDFRPPRGDNFRGRGGFQGERGGFHHRGRGKPYDRPGNMRPNFHHWPNDQFNQSNNSQHIKPLLGPPSEFQRPEPNQPSNFHRPAQNAPAQFPPQQNTAPPQQAPPMQQPAAQGFPAQPQANTVYPQYAQVPANPQIPPQAPASYPPPYSGQMYQNQAAVAPVYGAMPTQVLNPVANTSQPGIVNQPAAQQTLPAANIPAGALQQQGAGANQGYTVYERFVNYQHPTEVQAVASQPSSVAATAVYQQVGQTPGAVPTNKDAYANAQLQYERYAGATSRAAVYANAYYGSNTTSAAMPANNMIQAIPLATASPVVQPLPVQYHQ